MRWLRYPIALTVVLTLAISAAMLIGRAQPLPERVALLHLNDLCKLPCWIGITPGVTTLDDAIARVKDVYGKLPAYDLHCYESGPCILDKDADQILVINFYGMTDATNHLLISDIELFPSFVLSANRVLSAGYTQMADVVGNLYSPEQIKIFGNNASDGYELWYNIYQIVVLPTNEIMLPINWTQKISTIFIYREYHPYRVVDGEYVQLQTWRGFGHTYK